MAIDYFQELLAKYRNIQYPNSSQRQVDTLRNDLRKEILTPQFEQARMEYENMLSGNRLSRRSIDATKGGEQQQIIINPTTGATEIVTPEYNRQFRTDNLDFNPVGGGIFQNIYDVDEGKIDPRTGKPKDEEVVEDINTGLIGNTGGRGDGRDKDQGANMAYSHEVINGVAYRIDNETGEVSMLDGLDATIAKTLASYVNNFTIGGILNRNETYQDKLDRIKDISEEAYNEVTANVREQARVNGTFDNDNETTFDKLKSLTDKLKGYFGEDTDKPDGTNNTGGGLQEGYGETEQDVNRESFRGRTTPDGGGGGGNSDGGGNSCFVKGTMLQMADGTQKEISTVELGDNTKGGIVEMTMQGLPQTIYNYKDVLVSGSHWVIEDNEFVAVEDSKHGVLTDKVEPVYTLKTSDHRMWINDIEFGDFETGSDNDWEPHFEMVRQKLNKELSNGK